MANNLILQQKINQSKILIAEALTTFPPEQTMIAWSAGKDSTLVLKLTIDVCKEKNISVPKVLDIDQEDQFDEIINFRNDLVHQWDLDLVIVRNSDFLIKAKKIGNTVSCHLLNITNKAALQHIGFSEQKIKWIPDSPNCNHLLKTLPINQTIEDQQIKALYTGIRWDELGSREDETYFSKRETPEHMRVHPILHMTERDIWDAMFLLGIPYNDLYIQGYRSIGTKTGTTKNSNTPAWEQDFNSISERQGRSKEKEKMMDQLRAWGYI